MMISHWKKPLVSYLRSFLHLFNSHGRGTMVKELRLQIAAAWRARSIPASCRFSPLSAPEHRCFDEHCVLGQDTSHSCASLHSCANEYLAGQRWQCAKMVVGLYALWGVEMTQCTTWMHSRHLDQELKWAEGSSEWMNGTFVQQKCNWKLSKENDTDSKGYNTD